MQAAMRCSEQLESAVIRKNAFNGKVLVSFMYTLRMSDTYNVSWLDLFQHPIHMLGCILLQYISDSDAISKYRVKGTGLVSGQLYPSHQQIHRLDAPRTVPKRRARSKVR